jgi:hypothetical protein
LALDEKIYELRREKLKQIEALGQQVYPRKYEFTHTIPQILAAYSEKTAEQLENPRINVRVAGRIMAIRLMGKAGFAVGFGSVAVAGAALVSGAGTGTGSGLVASVVEGVVAARLFVTGSVLGGAAGAFSSKSEATKAKALVGDSISIHRSTVRISFTAVPRSSRTMMLKFSPGPLRMLTRLMLTVLPPVSM